MNNTRKPWELTDDQVQTVINSWTNETGVTLNRTVATAAARKALEWAEHECGEWSYAHAVANKIRKELSDD